MKTISTFPLAHQLVRSISLPTRTHPSSQRVEAHLNHLKSSLERSVSIQDELAVLAELYNCMEELFQSPHTQQSLLHYQNGQLVKEALCGSVILLDACEVARDLLSILKELQTYQSALQRRRGALSIENEISAYVSLRKRAKKDIAKQLVELKRMESKVSSFSILGLDQNLAFLAIVLTSKRSKKHHHLFISFSAIVFVHENKRVILFHLKDEVHETVFFREKNSEIGDLNLVVCSVLKRVRNGDAKVEVTQRMLETLNVSIERIEGGLDSIYKRLVQNRVSFLNMIAH